MRGAIPVLLLLESAAAANAVRFLGSHPIPDASGGGYCYIEVTHIHQYRPTPDCLFQEVDGVRIPDFVVKDGVAFYIGLFSPYFFQLKARVGRAVNAFYRAHARLRPAIDVSPPPEWRNDLRLPVVTRELHGSSEHKQLVRFHRDASTH